MKIQDILLCTFKGDTNNPAIWFVLKITDINTVSNSFSCSIMETKK